MKYWIDTFQFTGIAMFAGAVIASPVPVYGAVIWGLFLVVMGFLLQIISGRR